MTCCWLRFFFCILCLLSSLSLRAQTDTAFWFAAPDINARHSDAPIELKLIGLTQNASVKIYQPANSSFIPLTVSVAANTVVRVNLTSRLSAVETALPQAVNKTGLKIESTRPIQAYYEVVGQNLNTEIFTLKGRNALDTLFYVPGNNLLPNWSTQPGQTYYNGVLIQAEQNNTVIRLRSPVIVNGRPAGTTLQVTLQKGEVYFLRSTNGTKAAKLAGTRIASDKPVAVTFYDDSVYPRDWDPAAGSCADLCGDQAVGVSFLGNTHVAIRGPGLTAPLNDIVFITAVKDSTRLQINGSFIRWMKEAETYSHMMASTETITLVETSQPVTVAQISGFGCEVGMALIPNLECTGSQSAAFTRSDATAGTTFSINLLVPAGFEKSFRINGGLLSAARQSLFAFIPGTGNRWKYAKIDLTADFGANANVRVSNDSVVFHCGVINGNRSTGCRFGYFSDFSKVRPRFNLAGLVAACAGEPFRLSFNVPGRAGTEWILPDKRKIQSPSLYLPRVGMRDSGLYVGLFNNPGCGIQSRDSVVLRMDSIHLSFQPAAGYCAYDSIRIPAKLFSVSGMAGWSWSFRSRPSGGTVFRAGPQAAGSYPLLLSGSSRLGCVTSFADTIEVLPTPDARFTLPATLCVGDAVTLLHNSGYGRAGITGTRRWYLNQRYIGSDSSLRLNTDTARSLRVALKLTNSAGCVDSFAANTRIYALPVASLQVQDACLGTPAQLRATVNWFAQNPDTVFWNHGDGSSRGGLSSDPVYAAAGTYRLVFTAVSEFGCRDTFQSNLRINPLPGVNANGNVFTCVGDTVERRFNGFWNGPRGSYRWTRNYLTIGSDSLLKFSLSQGGNLRLALIMRNGFGCEDSLVNTYSITDRPLLQPRADTVCFPQPSALGGLVQWGNATPGSVEWASGDGTLYSDSFARHRYAKAGTYRAVFRAAAAEGCRDSAALTVLVRPRPLAQFSVQPELPFADSTALLRNESSGALLYDWFLQQQLLSQETNATFRVPKGGYYPIWLIAISAQGCRDTSEQRILVAEKVRIHIPNAFTPNGDGFNDVFRVHGLENIAARYFLRIYSRWGEKLYETALSEEGWDGRYGPEARVCPQEQYVYYMFCRDIYGQVHQRSGTFLLLR